SGAAGPGSQATASNNARNPPMRRTSTILPFLGVMTSPLDTTVHRRAGSPPPAPRRLVATCVGGRPVLSHRSVALPTGTLEIGRAVGPEELGLATDPSVSRRHAIIEVDGQGNVTLRRVGSGVTQVNGHDVDAAALREGDLVVLGESALVLRSGGQG